MPIGHHSTCKFPVLLPDSTIERLTGYKRPSDQVAWLRRHGWKITVNGLGRPNVAIAEFNRRQVGGYTGGQEPNWEAVDGSKAHTG